MRPGAKRLPFPPPGASVLGRPLAPSPPRERIQKRTTLNRRWFAVGSRASAEMRSGQCGVRQKTAKPGENAADAG